MSLKATVALFLVLVILCAGYGLMLTLEKTGRQQVIEAKRLFAFQANDVTALEVARLGEQSTGANRQAGGAWAFTPPHDAIEVNQVVWNRVATALADLRNERSIDSPANDLAGYGLDEPMLTVAGAAADGGRVKVAFGAEEPTQLNHYARLLEGGPQNVFLVANNTFHELDRSLLDLRNRFLVAIGDKGITRVEFALFWRGTPKEAAKAKEKGLEIGSESVAVVVERAEDGPWRMVEPVEGPANQELVADLVKEVQFATGRDYIDSPKNLADYGLDPPVARITEASGSGPKQTTLFGSFSNSEKGGVYVKLASRPAVFVIDSHIVTLFPRNIDSFREDRLLTHRASDIKQVHYRTADTDVTLVNDPDKGWSMTRPAVQDVDQSAVSAFMSALKGLRASAFPEETDGMTGAQSGLDSPDIAITLTLGGEEKPVEILIGAPVPGEPACYAVQDTGTLVMVPLHVVEGIRWTVFDFRSRSLMRFAHGAAFRLSLAFEDKEYLFEKVRGKWLVRVPAEGVLENQSDMEILLKALNPVLALGVESEQVPADLSAYGLDKPLCRASVTVRASDKAGVDDETAGAETVQGPLCIGSTAPGDSRQRFATMQGHPEVFRVKQDIVDDIRAALRGIRER